MLPHFLGCRGCPPAMPFADHLKREDIVCLDCRVQSVNALLFGSGTSCERGRTYDRAKDDQLSLWSSRQFREVSDWLVSPLPFGERQAFFYRNNSK